MLFNLIAQNHLNLRNTWLVNGVLLRSQKSSNYRFLAFGWRKKYVLFEEESSRPHVFNMTTEGFVCIIIIIRIISIPEQRDVSNLCNFNTIILQPCDVPKYIPDRGLQPRRTHTRIATTVMCKKFTKKYFTNNDKTTRVTNGTSFRRPIKMSTFPPDCSCIYLQQVFEL